MMSLESVSVRVEGGDLRDEITSALLQCKAVVSVQIKLNQGSFASSVLEHVMMISCNHNSGKVHVRC